MIPFTKLNQLFWGTIYWSRAHLSILSREDLTASQNLRLGNTFTQQLSQWHDKSEVVRHLFLNELLSFLRMHMHEVQLRRYWPPERINIPDIGLWWDHTKTKKMITLLISFLFRSQTKVMYFLTVLILTTLDSPIWQNNVEGKSPPQESFPAPRLSTSSEDHGAVRSQGAQAAD